MMLKVKKLHENAHIPTRANAKAAGYDLYSLESGSVQPKSRSLIKTGISVQIPTLDYPYRCYGSIRSRSGLSYRMGIEVGAGVIDIDYTGEIGVVIHNHSNDVWEYNAGERIAQLVLEVHITPSVLEVGSIERTSRGDGGFGSTGK